MTLILKVLKTVFIGLTILGLHALLLAHLVQPAPAKTPLPTPKPIMVNLITPPVKQSLPPVVAPVKPAPKPAFMEKPVKKVKRVKKVRKVKKVKRVKKRKKLKRVKKFKKSIKKRKKSVKLAKSKMRKVEAKTVTSVVKRQNFSQPVTRNQSQTTGQRRIAQTVSQPIRTSNSSQWRSGQTHHKTRPKKREVITPPSYKAAYLHNPPPKYPRLSKRLGEEGKVLLRVKVNKQGRAAVIQLQQSSGSTRLDKAARKAVNQWRFIPAKKAGKAVTGWVIVPVVFKLR
jgi:periplasmic protein TonB